MLGATDLHVAIDVDAGLLKAVDGLSMSIERGETFALVGESGCGKSVTALALLRLLPDNGRIAGGDIRLADTDLLALPEAAMRGVRGGRIGMIFQEPATSLNPVMRVGEQIVESIEAHTELRGAAARARAIEWLGRVGIAEPQRRIDEYPFRLSGGQKQRVMTAMVLAAEPDFLIADEPTTALDVTTQAQILDLLRSLQREQRMGLLLITHDLAAVASLAHRVALMYAGQIVEVAPADEFFAAPRHPYAELLLRALPESAKRGAALAAIRGSVPPLTLRFPGCRFAPRCDRAMAHCATTPVPLFDVGTRAVRCLLFDAGAAAGAVVAASATARAEPVEALDTRAGAPPLLDIQHLSVSFPIRHGLLQRPHAWFAAVRDVSLSIGAARTLALVGESGCGKTTLGKAVVQLLRGQARIEGRALLDGRDLFGLHGDALIEARRGIQMIFQDPFASLNPRLRVADILEEGLLALRSEMDASARRSRIDELLDQVGLRSDALARFPHEFSGGQRQRIAIARALAVRPKLIVCDEPTSALDVSVQAQILNLLAELQRTLGVSYLFITHNIGVVEYLADDVAVMHTGAVVDSGSAAQVLHAPRHERTRALLAAVPRLRVSRQREDSAGQ